MAIDPVLNRLAFVVCESEGLESLVRPLLELLESVTGLESTYFTHIDKDGGLQHIIFAHNTQGLHIPEGLSVPWGDTLCKRALDENHGYTNDVSSCWPDSTAATELGITTYLSEPVRLAPDEVYGTLCGASTSQVAVSPQTRRLLSMFATLIARQLERDRLLEHLQRENRLYNQYALSDPLTGIPNRRALDMELDRTIANAKRSGGAYYLAFIDLDGFKAINDQYGHDAGDRFLIEMSRALIAGLREGDFVARYGGDEFVVLGPVGTANTDTDSSSCEAITHRVQNITTGVFTVDTINLDYPGASVGVIIFDQSDKDAQSILARADAAMYANKKSRRN